MSHQTSRLALRSTFSWHEKWCIFTRHCYVCEHAVQSRRLNICNCLLLLLFDVTVRKRFFSDNFVIFRRRSKTVAFLESMNFSTHAYVHNFNFSDGHVTTFRHLSGAYICQMPGHWLCRLAKGTPSESQLSIGTIGLG